MRRGGGDTYDSILNKTPLTAASNRAIGGDAPSEYLSRIERKHGITSEHMDSILRSHLIEPGFLRTNDFEGFLAGRKRRLAALAGTAMGLANVSPDARGEPEEELSYDALEEEAADGQIFAERTLQQAQV